jgi:iron complex transport system substrate-binding protein
MRIVSLLPAATEIVFELGLGDQVVALSHECNYPPGAQTKPRVTRSRIFDAVPSAAIDEQVKSAIAAGEPLYALDVDLTAALAPDLIITQTQCDVCAVRYADVVDACKRTLGLQHANILALNPTSLAEVLSDIERIGDAARALPEAKVLVARLNKRIRMVRELTSELDLRPRIVIVEWIEPLMVAGNWNPELIRFAGGVNGLSNSGQPSKYHSWDELIAFDPQVIVVAPCGFDLARTLDEMPVLAQQTGWKNISAVRTGRVFAVDGDSYFNRAGPRLVDSLELLASVLHTELFPPVDDSICRRWSA